MEKVKREVTLLPHSSLFLLSRAFSSLCAVFETSALLFLFSACSFLLFLLYCSCFVLPLSRFVFHFSHLLIFPFFFLLLPSYISTVFLSPWGSFRQYPKQRKKSGAQRIPEYFYGKGNERLEERLYYSLGFLQAVSETAQEVRS